MSLDETFADQRTNPLERVRGDRRTRLAAQAFAALLGLALASLSFWGLVAGGALVALLARDVRRGVLAALGFAALVFLIFGLWLAADGVLVPVATMGQPTLVAVAAGVVLPLLGSLVRAVV